ncbi:hypothetical protein NBO_24g0030 [Nosema bombycis CQ1]|uniref:Uncharacterized protein n=1 Tax=Nosema bombycis (strain CQ1 / CVCC 102059) TaxID=578461 RepID=R0MK21_NOSB1|nr:hypothetical protein NBO_24g0030 [Nosema bombycis CQ1]|eukprot:EOB14585.1 hypothetical protein NBO_24g0030 [Nosema bombycis CQ1]
MIPIKLVLGSSYRRYRTSLKIHFLNKNIAIKFICFLSSYTTETIKSTKFD